MKKQRGQKRKLKKFQVYLKQQTQTLSLDPSMIMDHWHMPCSENFANNASSKVQTTMLRDLIDRGRRLKAYKQANNLNLSLWVIVTYPDIWNAQIVVYNNPENNPYLKDLFNSCERTPYYGPSLNKQRNLASDVKETALQWKVYDDTRLVYKTILYCYEFI